MQLTPQTARIQTAIIYTSESIYKAVMAKLALYSPGELHRGPAG
jgi:hypothetical protein